MRKLLLCGVFALAGCAQTLGPLIEAVGGDPNKAVEVEQEVIDNALRPVPIYCSAPAATREKFRERVNSSETMQGHKLAVWCVGDPLVTLGE